MAYIRRTVERIIESDPTIRTGLQRGIINSRALSRYILETCAVDSTPDAVLGVLRRYPWDGQREEDEQELSLKNCHVLVRSRMAYLTVENAPDVMKKVGEFASTIRSTRGETFRVVVCSDSVRVIAGEEALDGFRQSFRPKEVLSYLQELAEVCLLLPFGAGRLGEIATAVTAQLTVNEINPVGILVCPPEDIIIVSESDAPRTFEAVQQLLKEKVRRKPLRLREEENGSWKQQSIAKALRFGDASGIPIMAS